MYPNSTLSITHKIIHVVLFVLFSLFAFVQLNDPDALVWFLIYAIVALLCLVSIFKNLPIQYYNYSIIFLIAYAVFHFSLFLTYLNTPKKSEIFGEMVYEKPYLEGSREFLGLLIAALGVYYVKRMAVKKSK